MKGVDFDPMVATTIFAFLTPLLAEGLDSHILVGIDFHPWSCCVVLLKKITMSEDHLSQREINSRAACLWVAVQAYGDNSQPWKDCLKLTAAQNHLEQASFNQRQTLCPNCSCPSANLGQLIVFLNNCCVRGLLHLHFDFSHLYPKSRQEAMYRQVLGQKPVSPSAFQSLRKDLQWLFSTLVLL